MKKWAVIVVLLYGLTLLILTLPVLVTSFWDFSKHGSAWSVDELRNMFFNWPYWLGIVIFLLSQAALLIIPVRASLNRPQSKRTVWLPIALSAFMMALLVAGFIMAISETARGKKFTDENIWLWISLGALLVSWFVWAVVFYRWSRKTEPESFLSKICRFLYYGSILELLVAIPTHIVARYRNYCCAGFGTFFGITFGIAIMFLSFGPGVFFLFVKRWKKLHPVNKGGSMAVFNVVYEGDYRVRTMNTNGQPITTDAAKVYGGKGEALGPVDLMVVSLGNCAMTVMSMVAHKQGIDIKGTRIELESSLIPGPEHKIDTITMRFYMAKGIDLARRKTLETIAVNCPVHKNLNPQIKYNIDFKYPD
jgi:putative redox protein